MTKSRTEGAGESRRKLSIGESTERRAERTEGPGREGEATRRRSECRMLETTPETNSTV